MTLTDIERDPVGLRSNTIPHRLLAQNVLPGQYRACLEKNDKADITLETGWVAAQQNQAD